MKWDVGREKVRLGRCWNRLFKGVGGRVREMGVLLRGRSEEECVGR